ncbi:hypothetical protein [Streptomyces sp. NPDC004296]|uniref:hypothetical protein n=1 Tax=Streptomyces sp. NPDC004296 TaxID=3364697 RepID=UPI0036C2C291
MTTTDDHTPSAADGTSAQTDGPNEAKPSPRRSGGAPSLSIPWWSLKKPVLHAAGPDDDPAVAPDGDLEDADRPERDGEEEKGDDPREQFAEAVRSGVARALAEHDAGKEAREQQELEEAEAAAQEEVHQAKRQEHRQAVVHSVTPRRLRSPFIRFVVFNSSAALAGYTVGLRAYLVQFPQAAVSAAGGVLGFAAALAAGYGAWKVVTHKAAAQIVPFGWIGQSIAILGAAELGRRLGPQLLPLVSAYASRHVALTQQDVSLLIVGLCMCGLSGWLVWRNRAKSWLVRWLSRIPLATSLTVCALFSTGPAA